MKPGVLGRNLLGCALSRAMIWGAGIWNLPLLCFFLGPLGNRPLTNIPTRSVWPLEDVDQPDLEEIEDEPEVGDDLSP